MFFLAAFPFESLVHTYAMWVEKAQKLKADAKRKNYSDIWRLKNGVKSQPMGKFTLRFLGID